MTAADDDEDDPQLKSLRAVWVSMRDEEPSDRGLSALMAAARAQAEEMRPQESWWQRVLVQLRRPPVLALATLVLLVGGGVILSQREDLRAKAVPEVSTGAEAPSADPPSAPAPQAPSMGSGDFGGAVVGGGAATMPPAEGQASGDDRAKAVATPAAEPVRRRATAPRPAAPAPAKSSSTTPKKKELQREAAPVEPMAIATGELEEAAPPPAAGAAAPADEVKDAEPTRGVTPSIDELIKQCDAAAARGDCTTAKRLAGKIQQLDPKIYRARVTTSTTIKPCL